MMIIDNIVELGQICYLKTDTEQLPRILTGIQVRASSLVYELSQGCAVSSHYDFEINLEKEFSQA